MTRNERGSLSGVCWTLAARSARQKRRYEIHSRRSLDDA